MTDVTVVIPVAPYHEAVAVEAAASCFAQTVQPVVWVIRDHARRGAGWARNEGIRRVQTPFVVFLDADDVISPHFIERCLQHMPARGYVYTDWKEDTSSGEVDKSAPTNPWMNGTYHVITTLLRTADVRRVGGFDITLPAAEDTDFYMKLLTAGICGVHLPQPLFHYRRGGQRASNFVNGPQYAPVMTLINSRYGGDSMACCGPNTPMESVPANDQQAGDVLVMATWAGNHVEVGRQTGRQYPRTGNGKTLYVNPLDQQARPDLFRLVNDVIPMPAQDAADDEEVIFFDPATMVNGVEGIAEALTPKPVNAVVTADELAATLPAAVKPDVKKVLATARKKKDSEKAGSSQSPVGE